MPIIFSPVVGRYTSLKQLRQCILARLLHEWRTPSLCASQYHWRHSHSTVLARKGGASDVTLYGKLQLSTNDTQFYEPFPPLRNLQHVHNGSIRYRMRRRMYINTLPSLYEKTEQKNTSCFRFNLSTFSVQRPFSWPTLGSKSFLASHEVLVYSVGDASENNQR